MEVDANCPTCSERITVDLAPEKTDFHCLHCMAPLFPNATDNFNTTLILDQCPFCGCAHLYRQKDFNRKLGVALLIIGIGLAYFTYGISILVLTLFDYWLFKRVGEVGCCYLCGAVFRDSKEVSRLDPFKLSLNDYYRSLKTS